LPGHYNAAADSAKETAFLIIVLTTLFHEIGFPYGWFLMVFLFGWLFWKTGRSAILGWSRLERLHRLIEEERWEIEHHRAQEKEELIALYAAKGFSGRLLEEVVEVLMADDNRLLQVMLEEELGLQVESYEHPLKQALGAAAGVIGASIMIAFGLFALPYLGALTLAGVVIALSAGIVASKEKNRPLPSIVWNLAAAALAAGCAYFLGQILLLSPP
jgi:VIT1/CCC1 family predicted Fe2+/Mn2+ transporter